MTEKRFTVFKSKLTGLFVVNDNIHEFQFEGVENASTIMKLVGLLNNYIEENEQLKQRNKRFEEKIQRERNSFTKTHERWSKEAETKIKELSEENEQLKQFIQELTTKGTGRIYLADGYSYSVSAILTNWKGDVE